MEAVVNKQAECARELLPHSDLALRNKQGHAALHVAVNAASEACFELLLPVCDVHVRTTVGTGAAAHSFNMTALHVACHVGQLPMVKALLSRGADRVARDNRQLTPLHVAVNGGHLSCVVMLVGRPDRVRMTPAEVDAADHEGMTALHFAAGHGFNMICSMLLGAGARLDAKTSAGATPRMLAQLYQPTNAKLLALLSGGDATLPLVMACDHCCRTAAEASVKSLKSCGTCFVVHYCNRECQLAAWPGHKAACKAKAKELEKTTQVKVMEPPAST
jgi:ankyrin repeat protein